MLTEAPRSMDPADQNATATRSVLSSFYETLVQFDAEGHIAPLIATDWTSSADGLEWRFRIRHGVLFHNGMPCDASAVVASFNRLLDPDIALAGAGVSRAVIRSVRHEGDEVVFTLISPYADFLALMTMTQTAIVALAGVEQGTLGRHAVGTGPYVFEAWHSGDDVLAKRNAAYWGTKSFFEWLDWRWSPEPSVLNMALQTGDADVVGPLSPVFAPLYQAKNLGASVYSVTGSTLFWAALNTRIKPLDDTRVRRALSLAIDRNGLVSGLLHGYGRPACSALTPDIDGALSCGPSEAGPDIEAARRLLVSAGVGDGFRLVVIVQEAEEPIAEALQAMWREIGVRLEIRRQEAGVWVQAAFAPPSVKAREETGVILTSWSAPFLADMQLRPIYMSTSAAPKSVNLGFFKNLVVDGLIEQAGRMTDAVERRALLKQIQIILQQQAPVLPLYVANTVYGVRTGLAGVTAGADGEILVKQAHETYVAPEYRP